MPRKRIPFTKEEVIKICSLYKEGYGTHKICEMIPSLSWRKPQTLYPVLIKAGLYKKKPANDRRQYKVDDTFFDVINTEHKAYWLGFMIADGFLMDSGHAKNTFGMALKSCDGYILEEFKKDLNTTYPIRTYQTENFWGDKLVPFEYTKLLVRSSNISNALRNLGFTTSKSYNAVLPLEHVPDHLIRHLVRGYFDGDGGLSIAGEKKYHTYSLAFTGTTEVICSIRHILGKDNVKLSHRHKDRDNNNASLALCGDRQVYQICKWMYDGATIFLKRKYERYLKLEEKYNKKQSSPQECGRSLAG